MANRQLESEKEAYIEMYEAVLGAMDELIVRLQTFISEADRNETEAGVMHKRYDNLQAEHQSCKKKLKD
jgi:hypothetical protein